MPQPKFKRLMAAILAGSGPGLPLGQVATRSYMPNVKTGTTQYANTQSGHIMAVSSSGVQIALPGFYVNNGIESNVGGATTYTASIEYPVGGTRTQVAWSGSASTVAPNGGMTPLSDVCPVPMPAGAIFIVRAAPVGAAVGLAVTQATTSTKWSTYDAGEYSSTSLGDKTMSGTITDSGNGVFVYPCAIVAQTASASVALVGDSRTIGTISAGQGTALDANGCQGQVTPSLGAAVPWINIGVGGSLLYDFNRGSINRRALAKYCTHILNSYGINDLRAAGGNRTALQLQGDAITFAKMFPGKPLLLSTIVPGTVTSTDSFATAASQTADTNDAARIAANTWIKTVPAPYSGVLDVASIHEDQSNPGKWITSPTPPYTSDGLHASANGYTLLKNSGVITPALITSKTALPQFSLLALATTVAWADVSDPATAPSSGAPLQCRGFGGSYALSTAAPTYSATSFNGGPGYTFDGSTQALNSATTPFIALSNNAAGISYGLLFSLTSNPASTRSIFGCTINSGAGVPRAAIQVDTLGRPGLALRRVDTDATTTVFSSTALTLGAPALLTAVFDPIGQLASLYVNGVLACSVAFPTSGNFPASNSAGFSIALQSSNFTAMVLREGVSLNAALSAADRQKLEGDIAWRQGVNTLVLSPGHPYYAAAPTSN